ncbi:MAG: hypothetical protein WC822_01355 [Candidatus Paceibacterota bacterium]|jgi:hypothetical protein
MKFGLPEPIISTEAMLRSYAADFVRQAERGELVHLSDSELLTLHSVTETIAMLAETEYDRRNPFEKSDEARNAQQRNGEV